MKYNEISFHKVCLVDSTVYVGIQPTEQPSEITKHCHMQWPHENPAIYSEIEYQQGAANI